MQYRFYIKAGRDFIYDPDEILDSVSKVIELEGDGIDDKITEKIKELYGSSLTGFSDDFDGEVNSVTELNRYGRGDVDAREVSSVVAVLKPKSEIHVRCGLRFTFADGATKEQRLLFLQNNLNKYVFCMVSDTYSYEEIPDVGMAISGFCSAQYTELAELKRKYGFKMDIDDLMYVQNYFLSESREPTLAELKITDSFFSENFRHTTFETVLDRVETDDPAVKAAWEKYLQLRESGSKHSLSDITRAALESQKPGNIVKATRKLNAVKLETADENDNLLLVAKNESHNRSTTAVPYDGASGAVSGAVKDLLCAFGYAYESYRVTGTGSSGECGRKSLLSSAGYAEAASRLGIPCTKCMETVSDMYNEKQLEVCSVLAVADRTNCESMIKKSPQTDDKIYIVGGRTGADGISCGYLSMREGGNSIGEYVPVTRSGELAALQRLFINKRFTEIAVAVNDVGSGGIICAIGEIVSGANIDCGSVAVKYNGLSCVDILLSESDERMIVCVRSENAGALESLCKAEGIECCCIASVNDTGNFVVTDSGGRRVIALSGEFLVSGGAEKHLGAHIGKSPEYTESEALKAVKATFEKVSRIKKLFGKVPRYDYETAYRIAAKEITDISCELDHSFNRAAGGSCTEYGFKAGESSVSVRELSYNGKTLKDKNGEPICSVLSCGTVPEISSTDPFKGAYLSVAEAVLKLVASGYGERDIYLSLQESFLEHRNSSVRLGASVATTLGVFEAQMQLGHVSIGGRVSIGSGSSDSENASAVTAFAFCTGSKSRHIKSAFEKVGNRIVLLSPEESKNSVLPDGEALRELISEVNGLAKSGKIRSAAPVNARSAAAVLMEMCRAHRNGVKFTQECSVDIMFGKSYCSVICEVSKDTELPKRAELIGYVSDDFRFTKGDEYFELSQIFGTEEKRVTCNVPEAHFVYLKKINDGYGKIKPVDGNKVKALIVQTPYSVSENGVRADFESLGAAAEIFALHEKNIPDFIKALKKTDILWLCDGAGSSLFLSAVLSDKKVQAEIGRLRERKGLIYGFGSAFDALVKSGLIGLDTKRICFSGESEVLTNESVILKSVSRRSPFMRHCEEGGLYSGYVSGKGLKLVTDIGYARELAYSGRIGTQFDDNSNAVNSSVSIDSVCSEDGLVTGQISRPIRDDGAIQLIKSGFDYFSTYDTL